jgi:DNA repair exonuclease SbcCD nuclease subunit
MFTFLHAADVHLDSPLKNLALREGAPVDLVRGATRRAFDKLVQLAVDEEVDFLLLAGDLYDGTWKDYNTGLFFISRMRRLREAGIRVFLVSGNHDAAGKITRSLRLPGNVVHFSSRSAQTEQLEELGVAIHGRSYSRPAESRNLALEYPAPVPGYFNIGLLHTALSGRPGHEPYAPCSRDDLVHKGYDYWALGHVHQREEVQRDPWIVFPGNLQGRHVRETGPRGAYLVRVDGTVVQEAEFRELDVARWARCSVDCSDCADLEEVLDRVGAALGRELDQADGLPLMLRMQLEGATELHPELVRDTRHLQGEIEALALDSGDIWLERLRLRTALPRESGAAGLAGTPLEGFLQGRIKDDDGLFDAPSLQALEARLPPELLRDEPLVPEDPEERHRLLSEVRDMVLAAILHQVKQ